MSHVFYFGKWAAHSKTPPSVYRACNSDSEIRSAPQTVEAVVRTQRHRSDADNFPMFWVYEPDKEFVAVVVFPVRLSTGCHHDVTR